MANKKNKKIILILTPGFPENEADSTCLPMQQAFVKSLSEYDPGIEIIVVSFQYPYKKDNYLWNGIQVISFGGKNRGGFAKWMLFGRIYNKLERLRKSNEPIGIISFWCRECALIGKKFSRWYNIPHFIWILGQDARKENEYVRRIKPAPHELIALSDQIQTYFEENHGIRPSKVITPGVDLSLFDNPSPVREIDILGVGSMIPLKQFNIFLEIVAELKKTKPEIKAMLIGNGPEEETLWEQKKSSNLDQNIMMTGGLQHDEVIILMKKAKILLHPSSYEGYSGVCMEALACGAHVISFCRAMNKEINQWTICKSKEEMIIEANKILNDSSIGYQPQDFPISDTAKQFMQLFGQ